MRARRLGIGVAVVALIAQVAVFGTGAGAGQPHAPAIDPAFVPTGLQVFSEYNQRGEDQFANLAYLKAFIPGFNEFVRATAVGDPIPDRVQVDPFRWTWPASRGTVTKVSWANRYGARISGHVWVPKLPWHDPVTGAAHSGPLPAVVFVPGVGGYEGGYWGIVQSVAEAGYVVLSFDPQGQGDSDVRPASQYCQPGAWQQPQEGGIREQGSCAGVFPALPYPKTIVPDPPPPLPPLGFMIGSRDGEFSVDSVGAAYDVFRPNFVFGALDAVQWLLSDSNPARALIDPTRIGVMGHSAGSDAAVVAAGVDPLHRFRAAVAFDDYGHPPAAWSPTVPTMIQQSELQDSLGPYLAKPAADTFPSRADYGRLVGAGTAAALVAFRASSHADFAYIPEELIDPLTIGVGSSRYGERLAVYYTVGWLDRWLKGVDTGGGVWNTTAERIDADRRLLAARYDGSVDGSSIGQGTYDAIHNRNVPYRLAGLRAADRLSPIVDSPVAFDGAVCADLRLGC